MRFSETLRFNANPDWWTYYLPYDTLKQHVATLQHLKVSLYLHPPTPNHESSDEEPDEPHTPTRRPIFRRTASQRVLAEQPPHAGYSAVLEGLQTPIQKLYPERELKGGKGEFARAETKFMAHIEKSVVVVEQFYKRLCEELGKVTDEVLGDAASIFGDHEGDEEMPLLDSHMPAPSKEQLRVFKRRIVQHYKEVGETVNFSILNRTGFDKIMNKHDKCSDKKLRYSFMENLKKTATFLNTEPLEMYQRMIEGVYAHVYKNGNRTEAKKELKEALRELVIWDRNTIWRDVLRTERRVAAFHTIQGGENVDIGKQSAIVFKPKFWPCLIALLVFILVLMFPQLVKQLPLPDGRQYSKDTLAAANRCLAMTLGVIILWAFEGLPLYVTSFLVVPTSVLLTVFVNESGVSLNPQETSSAVFASLSSPTLILIICVYSLGAALSKFEIDKLVATSFLSRVRRADHLLLTVMFLAVFISMFVSNVAAPVLLSSVMMPTIDAMRDSPGTRRYVQCLLLGIMVASNIGGFASPIASPQAAVALGLLTGDNSVSFLKWCLAALPQCAVMVFAFYAVFYWMYKPQQYTLPPLPANTEKMKWPHWVIVCTLGVTVLLWSNHSLSDGFGDAGVVAVIPILVLFGSGILNKEDFNNLPWDVVYLVAGGTVLGTAVESCQLLDLVAGRLTDLIGVTNVRLTYYVFCTFMAIIANAVSHTVSAVIVLPLIYKIGVSVGHAPLLVLGGTFAASSAMAFPISSFPNMATLQVEDETGKAYVSAQELLKVGSLMTVIATVVLLTVGFELMMWLKL